MSASTRNITPGAPAPGAVSHAEAHPTTGSLNTFDPVLLRQGDARQAFARATQPDYFGWLDHIRAAAGCTRPIRLAGTVHHIDSATGQILATQATAQMPDGVIYKPCGNRRARVCPSCSAIYQHDAYQLVRAGLVGGKTVPDTVATHPAVFLTLTAPSFGTVHTRVVTKHTCHDLRRCDCRAQPCHIRRDHGGTCTHGQAAVCFARHEPDDPRLGQPLCLDCYDHQHHVVWNLFAGELWRRTKQAIERHLNTGHRQAKRPKVRISHGKVAEYQTRGAVHFHALLRVDGIHPTDPDALVPPPASIGAPELETAIRVALGHVEYTSASHPEQPDGWRIVWGEQVDIRPVTLTGEITDAKVAGYLAKYATKSTEATGYTSTRITQDTIRLHLDAADSHVRRLVAACWRLGTNPTPLVVDYDANPYLRLRRWAHMLGFGGHFLTKARRYSTTFAYIRGERVTHRRIQLLGPDGRHAQIGDQTQAHDDIVVVIGHLTYTGAGWHTLGDQLLANTTAAHARQTALVGREETSPHAPPLSELVVA